MGESYQREEWTKQRKLAPFRDGSLQSYYYPPRDILCEVSGSFQASLLLVNFDKGIRSAYRVIWESVEGNTYPMFISEFLSLVRKFYNEPLATFPRVDGTWEIVKRGQNYGISYIGKM